MKLRGTAELQEEITYDRLKAKINRGILGKTSRCLVLIAQFWMSRQRKEEEFVDRLNNWNERTITKAEMNEVRRVLYAEAENRLLA